MPCAFSEGNILPLLAKVQRGRAMTPTLNVRFTTREIAIVFAGLKALRREWVGPPPTDSFIQELDVLATRVLDQTLLKSDDKIEVLKHLASI